MVQAPIPDNEEQRLRSLHSYRILDSLPEEDYDHLTAIAAQICGTKISLVSLVDADRQWFKSHYGLSHTETPREIAFCGHAILNKEEPFVVNDARRDSRFFDNPLVRGEPHVIFYAGVPLVNQEGFALGTICVLDDKPKQLTEEQLNSLKYLSRQVVKLLELRQNNFLLHELVTSLQTKNKALEQFAFVAAHDLKSPLHQISAFTTKLQKSHLRADDIVGNKMIQFVHDATLKLGGLIDGLLDLSRVDQWARLEKKRVAIPVFVDHLRSFFSEDSKVHLSCVTDVSFLFVNETALTQILLNLLTNAVKYNDKEQTEIQLTISQQGNAYSFSVQDNGPGIPTEKIAQSLEVFSTLTEQDRYGRKGSGIGLALVKSLVEKLGGEFSLSSEVGHGLRCDFSISID